MATSARQPKKPNTPQGLSWQVLIWIAVAMLAAFFWSHSVHRQHVKHLTFSQFEQAVRHDRVNSVTVRGLDISGRLKAQKQSSGSGSGATKHNKASKPAQQNPNGKKQGQKFTTTRPPFGGAKLLNLLQQHNVQISAKTAQNPWWERLLISLLPWVLILGVIFYFSYRMQQRMGGSQGMFGMGRSKARRFRERSTGVTMEDVAGADNAKRDLGEVMDYLKEPQRYRKLGASIPRGVLMMGPPGTGKTLLAKAIAGEAGVPFYSISGSEFIEMFVGVGAARVRDMFKNAKAEAPALVFIDELDSIGRSRGSGMGGGNDEREQTLNQILSEMDGFDENDAVVVLAATNRPDVLDHALMRPGRFDRKVTMEKPSRKARESILRVHADDKPLANDVDLSVMADRTAGFSGADLENLLNEAALLAGRDRREEIDMAMLNRARDRLIFGAESDVGLSDEEKRVVAYHESGHALMAYLLPRADPLDKVTIIPRGRALGATEQTPGEERYNMSEHDLSDRIGVMLGGHMTEKLIFGEVTTGAEQDLAQVSQLARRMVANWGMNERIGPLSHRQQESHPFLGHGVPGPRDFSEYTAHQIDVEMRRLVVNISEQVYNLLQDNRDKLDTLAQELLAQETLEIDVIRRLLESEPAESAESAES